MIHSIDIIINTFIVLLAIQIWTIIGLIVVSQIEEYEPAESHLLTCFFWFVIVAGWINIKINDYFDKHLGD